MTTRELGALYQELVLDHGKAPRNEGALEGATHEATAKNPLCGDRVTVRVRVSGGVVHEARFEARGCLIARASASLLTEAIAGCTIERALALGNAVEALVAAGSQEPPELAGDSALSALRGARDFPARRACVTLAWKALEAALGSR